MDVVVRRHRNVEIDHVPQRFHVDSTRRDVGSDQHLIRAVFKTGQRLGALRLRSIAVNTLGFYPVRHELRGQTVRAVLRAREHQRLGHVAALEEFHQECTLELLRDRIDRLRNAFGRRRLTLEIERDGLVQHLLRQRRDWRGHRGAEEQRLPLAVRQVTQNLLDVGQEAHVEHAIGFVQHQELKLVELGVRLPEMIEQTPRCGDHDVNAATKRVLLRPHAHAPEHRRRSDRRVDRDVVQTFVNLRGQLARGCEHQRARGAAGLRHELMQNREQERVRLPAAGHGARQNVTAFEPRRDRIRLNGGRTGKPQLFEAAMQIGVQREAGERS